MPYIQKPSQPEEIEMVGLAEEAADQIAQRTGDYVLHAMTLASNVMNAKAFAPQRTQYETEGVKSKPGAGPVFYGGNDVYTDAGTTEAEIATNLYLASVILETPDPRTGRVPVERRASERMKQVMLGAAEKALGETPDLASHQKAADADGFVLKGYRAIRAEAKTKAMTSTGSNIGDEWVPTFASSELWRDTHLNTVVGANVRRVAQPTNPYDLPTLVTDPTFYYASSENTAVTASNAGTDKATLTSKKIQCEVDFSGELTEDSIVPMVPHLRQALVRRAAQTIDDLIVSGDTESGSSGNVNLDDSTPPAGSAYLALDGMRKFALVTNTAQKKQFSGAFTTTLFVNTRDKLLKYGARPSDLIVVMPPTTVYGVTDIDAFKLVSDYGPQATILTGELAKIFGIPVLGYEAIPGQSTDKVDDDGKYTNTSPSTNDTDGWFVIYNRDHWTSGFRREIQVESFRDIQKDQNILVCSFRMALIPSGIATTHTAVGYDITI